MTTEPDDLATGCYDCEREAELRAGSPVEDFELVYDGPLWRAAHAFNSALPGWLVLVPRRHVESLAELSADEAAELGPLIRTASAALGTVCGAQKTYLMQFAENEGFAHVHCHLVPRAPDLAAELRGPNVFWYLNRPEAEQLDVAQRNVVARDLRAAITAAGRG